MKFNPLYVLFSKMDPEDIRIYHFDCRCMVFCNTMQSCDGCNEQECMDYIDLRDLMIIKRYEEQ